MNLNTLKTNDTVMIIYFGGHYEPKPVKRTVTKVLKNYLVLSDGYKYHKETGRCAGYNYAIINE